MRMDAMAGDAVQRPRGQAWLSALRGRAARVAADALDDLPATAAAAGPDLPAIIAAWILADPETAADLFMAWLETADAAGHLSPACPVVCQWAERVAEAQPDPEKFLVGILPVLAKCLAGEFERYDARGTGLPVWSTADEALFPKEFSPGRFTVDLAVLLSNEAAAFRRLAVGHPDYARIAEMAEDEQQELDDWLRNNFWDESAATFLRCDAGAEGVPDDSPCGLLPLVWEDRTAAMVEALRPRAAQADYSSWPGRARLLFLALLLRTPHNTVLAQMRRFRLPPDAAPADRAAWTVLATGADATRGPFLKDIPRPVRWLDRHGRSMARALLAAAAVLVLVLLARAACLRDNASGGGVAELERRARLACAEARHDRAAAMYRQAARHGNAFYFRYKLAGEWMHLGHWAEAEAACRALLAEKPDTPNARVNLALAVFRQGRLAEARDLYREFAGEEAAAAYPELVARARLAATLIDRQLELDQSMP